MLKVRKTLTISLLFFILITSFFIITINQVKATNYEWIKDGGFESTPNLTILDVDGWDGTIDEWYNNSNLNTVLNQSTNKYIENIYEPVNDKIGNFTFEDIITGDIGTVILHLYEKRNPSDSEDIYELSVYGKNGWEIVGNYNPQSFSWTQREINLTSYFDTWIQVNDAKITFKDVGSGYHQGSGYRVMISEVDLYVYRETGQTELSFYTYPWYSNVQTSNVGITDSEFYEGTKSAYIIFNVATFGLTGIGQNINYLLTDNMTSLSLYALTTSITNVRIQVLLFYTDNTVSIFSSIGTNLNSTDGWTPINFVFEPYVPDGKLIKSIEFKILDATESSFTYLDDISLLATTEQSEYRFSWYLVPTPQYLNINDLWFSGYTLQAYTFYGSFYDINHELTEEGSFTVTSTYGTMPSNGVISNGQFSFVITVRPQILNGQSEELVITLNLAISGSFQFNIGINWFDNIGLYTPTPIPTPPIEIDRLNLAINFIIYFCVYFVPALMIVGATHERIDSVVGLIAGLCLSALIGWLTGLGIFPLVICMIVVGVLLFGKGRGYV